MSIKSTNIDFTLLPTPPSGYTYIGTDLDGTLKLKLDTGVIILPAGISYLRDLLDVNVSGMTIGEALVWDGSEWINADVIPDLTAYWTSGQTETAISVAVSSEASIRLSVDSSLSTAIINSAPSGLSQSLSDEVSTRTGADASLTEKLSSEISERTSGDLSLSSAIVAIPEFNPSGITASLSVEISERVSGDLSLTNKLSTEISNRASSDISLSSSVTGLTQSLSEEVSTRSGADASLTSKLSTEISDRTSSDVSLSTIISTDESKRDDLYNTSHHYSGFPDRVNSTLSLTGAIFAITGTNFPIYIKGEKYLKNTESVDISADVSGLIWFWYNETTHNLVSGFTGQAFSDCLIANIYWNATEQKGILADERHWFGRDMWNHEYLHETRGMAYHNGLTGTFTNTTLSITSGECYDEDIEINIPSGTTNNVLFHDGSSAWKWSGLTTPYFAIAGVLQYNNGNTLTPVGNNDYVASWVYATNGVVQPFVTIIGNRVDNSLSAARANNDPSSIVYGNIPGAEMKLLYRLILRNVGGTATYIESADYRNVSNLPSNSYTATDHNTLTNIGTLTHLQLEGSLSTNLSTTVSGDASLTSALSSEVSTRSGADASLSSAIVSEASTRTGVDGSLSTNITSVSGQTNWGTKIDLSTTTADTQILYRNGSTISGTTNLWPSLSTAVSSEVSTRTGADTSLSTAVSSEVSRSTSLSTAVSSEVSRSTSLSTAISTTNSTNVVQSTAISTISGSTMTQTDLTAVIVDGQLLGLTGTTWTGFTNSMPSLSTALSSEISTRTGTDTSLSTSIVNEASTRTGADTSLSSAIQSLLVALSTHIG